MACGLYHGPSLDPAACCNDMMQRASEHTLQSELRRLFTPFSTNGTASFLQGASEAVRQALIQTTQDTLGVQLV